LSEQKWQFVERATMRFRSLAPQFTPGREIRVPAGGTDSEILDAGFAATGAGFKKLFFTRTMLATAANRMIDALAAASSFLDPRSPIAKLLLVLECPTTRPARL
ncbi:MAG TPA: hypothetical protein VJX67_18000, partial [Blastocatellia bacterium]|nr:hypothetical protein [Blastocatellia bacterium]